MRRPSRPPIREAIPLLLVCLSSGACASDEVGRVGGVDYYVMEAVPPNTGALGTCASDDVTFPSTQGWARRKRWGTGAAVGIVGVLQDGCGGHFASVGDPSIAPRAIFGGSCAPLAPFSVEETNRASWTFLRDDGASFGGVHGNFAGTMRAEGPGTGGLRIVYDGTELPVLALDVARPGLLQVTRHVFQYGKGLVDEPTEGLAIATNASVVLIVRTFDDASNRLCGRAPLDVRDASGLDVRGDEVHAGTALTTNGAIVAHAGASPGTSRATLLSAGTSAPLMFDVLPLSAITSIDASTSPSMAGPLLRLRARSASREVAGPLLRVEILTREVVLTGEDGMLLPSPVETTAPALGIHAAAATRVHLRLSAPGTSAPIRELELVVEGQ